MKKIKFILFLVVMFSCTSKSGSDEIVYICTGPYAKSYHNDLDCRGIESCSADIKTVSIDKAESIGRTPCGYCY